VAKLGKRIFSGMAASAIIVQTNTAVHAKIIVFIFEVYLSLTAWANIFTQPL